MGQHAAVGQLSGDDQMRSSFHRLYPYALALCASSCSCEDTDPNDGGNGGQAGSTVTSSRSSSNSASDTSSSSSAMCSDPTADTMTDPLHCGACDDPCGVGSCVGGVCQTPQILAANLATLIDIATDGTTLFFTSGGHGMTYLDGGVYTMPIDGGVAPTFLVSSIPACAAVELDGDDVVFTANGTGSLDFVDGYLATMPKAGGATTILAPSQPYAHELILHGTSYLVAAAGTRPEFADGAIRSWDGATLEDVAVDQDSPAGLALDGDVLYWTTYEPENPMPTGALHRRDLITGVEETLHDGLNQPTSVVIAAGRVFFATRDAIQSFDPATPETLETFSDEGNTIARFAADASDLYWTEPGGRVVRKSLAGGPVIVLAEGLTQPYGLLLQDDYVYFTDRGTGVDDSSLQRIRK